MSTPATLLLRERETRRCVLALEEISYLLENHRPHLELRPTLQANEWLVRARGVVGVILTPRRRIVLEPRFPVSRLLDAWKPSPGAVGERGITVLDLFVEELADLMEERARKGLHRGYQERAYQGNVLVGRLDLAAQLRQAHLRPELHSRVDDFTVNLPCNQIPRTLAGQLLASPLLGSAARVRLLAACAAYAKVEVLPCLEGLRGRVQAPPGYEKLLRWCTLLTSLSGPRGEGQACSSMLVSLERWFEGCLARMLEEAFPSQGLEQQRVVVTAPGSEEVFVRPDLLLVREGKPILVLDCKWKGLREGGPMAEDLYQVLAYAQLLGVRHSLLVYPGRGRWRTLTFEQTPVRVHLARLDVSGPRTGCQRVRKRWTRNLTRLLEQTE